MTWPPLIRTHAKGALVLSWVSPESNIREISSRLAHPGIQRLTRNGFHPMSMPAQLGC
jgi:hypothetical protein